MERTLQLTGLPHPWLAQLVQQHLSPKERLSLFSVSTACARAVLQHTRKQRWRHRPSQAPPDPLQQLVAATAHNLELWYAGGAFPEGVVAATKELTVDGTAANLPWQRMALLQTVTLVGDEQAGHTLQGLCTAVQQGHLLQLHSLDVRSCVGKSAGALAARTLGPRLTSLSVRDVQPFMKHFSHFTRLTTLTFGSGCSSHLLLLEDSAYEQLATHPSLQHVRLVIPSDGILWPDTCRVCPTWPKLSIINPKVWYLDRPWMLQAGQVVLTGTIVVGLGSFRMGNEGQYARLLANLQQLGDRLRLEGNSADGPPQFMCGSSPCAGSKLLITHLAQHIHADQIGVSREDLSAAPVVALLSKLPQCVQQVKFTSCKCTQPVSAVLALLPTHVTHLMFNGWDADWAELLEGLLALPQHILLCTVEVDHTRSKGRAAAAVLQRLAIHRVVLVLQAGGA